MKITSTAISDLVLAASSFYGAYLARNIQPQVPTYGLILIGAAATLGVYRFSADSPNKDIVDAHRLLSWLGNIIAVPFIAGGLMKYNGHDQASMVTCLGAIGGLALYKWLSHDLRDKVNTAVPSLSVLGMIVSSAMAENYFGCYTGLGIVLAGILIGDSNGKILDMPKTDFFHYVLAGTNMLYMYALGINPKP